MTELIHTGRVCALILAGGRSRRMGRDKPLLSLGGRTLLERAVRFWRSCPGIDGVLVAVGAEDHFDALPDGAVPVRDLYPGCGPLAGLHAAFALTDAELVYVSAVDMPFLKESALLPEPKGDAAVYTKNGLPEPLFGVYRRTVLPALEAALRAGRRKASALLDELDTEYIEMREELMPVLDNLNTPEDMLRAAAGRPPAVVFTGWSGAGKTTFLEKLLPVLTARGLRVAVIKHDAHGFQMDRPGKDTYRFAQAGAVCTAISGPNGWAVLSADQITLEALKEKLPPVDLILVEGHKNSAYPMIVVCREAEEKPPVPANGPVLAYVTDMALEVPEPRLGLEDAEACAELICRTILKR